MPSTPFLRALAALLVLSLHAVLLLAMHGALQEFGRRKPPQPDRLVIELSLPPPEDAAPPPPPPLKPPRPKLQAKPPEPPPTALQSVLAVAPHPPASQAAPPPPTAEEWAFAAKYTLRNSKGYRHSWGQQVRSLMGTAVEGPEQGVVRFRIEIAPDGRLSRVHTLWTTSPAVEQRARKAIAALPPLPPTPTGKPLVFERTISFGPFAHDDPPTYDHDCLPQPPAFRNPFVWDGKSPQMRQPPPEPEPAMTAQEMEDCLRQLPQNSIDAEAARDRRAMERWGWSASAGPGAAAAADQK